jgi:hypothetical protein
VVSAKRVLDSTPLYDAVATQDTVTMIRSAIRQLVAAADPTLEAELRGVLRRDDDYGSGGKPTCDWDDAAAREQLVAELATDGFACLVVLEGRQLDPTVFQVAELLATVLGQDLEQGDDGRFRIARRVARDRVISTVDPDARHGHKTQARSFDGYKGHVAVDPDSEIITDTIVTPGNAGDASVAADLIGDLVDDDHGDDAKVYGDSAYGTGGFQQRLDDQGIDSGCRTQPPSPLPGGLFAKNRFGVNLDDDTVTCRPGSACRSAAAPTVTAWPASPNTAPTARCAASAPTRRGVAPSGSTSSKRRSPEPANAKRTPAGKPTTGPTDPRSNANSPTSCAAVTADAAPASAGDRRSTPTSTSSPPPPTSPGSARSAFAPPPPDGPSIHERPGQNPTIPAAPPRHRPRRPHRPGTQPHDTHPGPDMTLNRPISPSSGTRSTPAT